MPLYEYACRACGLAFEQYVRAFGDAVSCPRCQDSAVEKKISSFAFTMAGSPGAARTASGGGCGCGRGGCGCGH